MSDYYTIKTNCLRRRQLWEDPEFRAEQKSIFYKRVSGMPNFYRVVWKRPGEITHWPQFTIDGASKFDVDQGLSANCWFLAATSVVATKPELLEDVVPLDQSFDRDYAGIFRFNFWQYGRWEEVIVDDKLPTLDGQLIFCSNRDERREFWAALLEKAYAKIHGSYQALDAGWPLDALVDLTGGIGETMEISDYKNDRNYLFVVLKHIYRMNSLLCGAIWPKSHGQMEEILPNGLVTGHAYSITSIVEFEHYGQRVVLIRLLNPWGRQEWNGDWSDRSRQWRSIPARTRQALKLEPKDDGEFWMPFDEFMNNFDQIQICHLGPETALAGKRKWSVVSYHGEWIKGLNAGGSGLPPHEEKYWTNPQFFITLRDTNHWDGVDRCIMVVSLMQKYQRRKKTETQSLQHLHEAIAFDLHRFRGRVPKDLEFQQFDFRQLELVHSIQFLDSRERTQRFELDPGTYCIIPKTFHPDVEAEFLLRIATE